MIKSLFTAWTRRSHRITLNSELMILPRACLTPLVSIQQFPMNFSKLYYIVLLFLLTVVGKKTANKLQLATNFNLLNTERRNADFYYATGYSRLANIGTESRLCIFL